MLLDGNIQYENCLIYLHNTQIRIIIHFIIIYNKVILNDFLLTSFNFKAQNRIGIRTY